MRRIALILGSKSDLPQCCKGLELLEAARLRGEIEMSRGVVVSSIHRATDETLKHLRFLSRDEESLDVLITAAGWANHLTGMCDSYLRYELYNSRIVVVGVALEDLDNNCHTLAAKLSITEVPGNQVVFDDERKNFIGSDGFKRACEFAMNGLLPTITLPSPRPQETFSLKEAIAEAHHQRGGV
jgi:phosphoribosylcarboxyaminoimidazole (NCAIR) mutase